MAAHVLSRAQDAQVPEPLHTFVSSFFLISTLTARASMSHNLRSRCGYRVFFLFSFAIVKASTRPGRNGTRARLSNHNIAN